MGANPEYESIRRGSFGWIREAAAIALAKFGRVSIERKADRSPVTDADYAVQASLLEAIDRRYPGDAVITEETRSTGRTHGPAGEAGRCWVIDPIDGTRNYVRSLPVFTLSVAMFERGSPVVGWVCDPMMGRLYSASLGGGAWVDDERMVVNEAPDRSEPFMGIPTSRHEQLPRIAHEWIDRMMVRNLGSTALHLVMLATGAFDAVYCKRSKLWDLAAGALIAGETGAQLVAYTGAPYFPMDLTGYTDAQMPFIAARRPFLDQLVEEYQRSGC